jgi:hypothetical protein
VERKEPRRKRHHHRHHNRHRLFFFVEVGGERFGDELLPNQENRMSSTGAQVGQTITITATFVDNTPQANPMVPQPTPDSTPTWAQAAPSVESLVVAANGMSAVATVLTPGADTITFTAIVGGVTYTATLSVNDVAAPQVLGGVTLAAVVS